MPTPDEFKNYADARPRGGMPYGTAPIPDEEYATLASWLSQPAPAPALVPPDALPAPIVEQVETWESFLNGTSLKERITVRYLYEHWFVTHLYFRSHPSGPFFRIIRSSTPPGQVAREIATRRPYDRPGKSRFWYRLAPIRETIVHKTHVIYDLNSERL